MGQPAEARTHFIGCAVDAHPADFRDLDQIQMGEHKAGECAG